MSWHGHWYVVGHDRDRDAVRVFRLSRVVGAVVADGPAGSVAVPEGIDLRARVARLAGEPGAGDRAAAGTGRHLLGAAGRRLGRAAPADAPTRGRGAAQRAGTC